VGVGGAGPLGFGTTPLASEFATAVLNGGATTYSTTAGMDAGAQSVSATNVTRRLPTDGTVPPASFSGGFRHNTTALYIQSRPTTDNTNAASVMVATLQNTTGDIITSFTISYSFGLNNSLTGELPGFRVFYSLTGQPGSWQLIPSLSSTEVVGTHSANLAPGSWAPSAFLYLLWADDNANSITDPSYTIDNFSITAVTTTPAPASCVGITNQPSNLTVGERAAAFFSVGATGTPQHIQWYRDGVEIPGANAALYTLGPVLYASENGAQFFAMISNAVCIATSTVATLTVIADTNPPTVIGAVWDRSLDTVTVTFSEPIFDPGGLEQQFIVFPSGGEVQGGQELLTVGYLMTNGNQTILLKVVPARELGSNYSLYITQVSDVSSAHNALQPDPTIIPITSIVQLIGFDTDNVWKYSIGHSTLTNLHGTGWEQTGYDDAGWLSGAAGLGLDTGQPNEVPIRTTLPYATNSAIALNVSTYFRRHFNFPSTTNGVTLILRDMVEDGAVYYLNGREVFRNRMPAGPIMFATTTTSAAEPQSVTGPFQLAITNLWPGENVLAVELHQNGLNSSDMEFAAELTAEIPALSAFINPPLHISHQPGGTISISWSGSGVLQEATQLLNSGTVWTYVPGNPNPHVVTPGAGGKRFFRLRP